MKNKIIRTSREGWILVDVSTKKFPESYMYIDKEDWDYIQSLGHGRIFANKLKNTLYAICNELSEKRDMHLIHRLLFPDSQVVDHENHNGLDNRRFNLRPCTQSQNLMNRRKANNNTSGVMGVSWCNTFKKWTAGIKINGKKKNLGYFHDKEKAVQVRKKAEEKYFGEFKLKEVY